MRCPISRVVGVILCLLAVFNLFIILIPRYEKIASEAQAQSQSQNLEPQKSTPQPKKPRLKQQTEYSAVKQTQTEHSAVFVTSDVHIFYYPWYGTPQHDGQYLHWNHKTIKHWQADVAARYPEVTHQPPDDIGASFFPQIGRICATMPYNYMVGCYSSKDPEIVRLHAKQIASSGVGVMVVSWYHPKEHDGNGASIDETFPTILNAAEEAGIKVAFHLEPGKRSVVNIRRDLGYIDQQYGSHPAVYRVKNLPVFYVYDSYLMATSEWAKMFACKSGDECVRGTNLDGIFLGLVVEQAHLDALVAGGFDGVYSYFAVDGFSYGSTMRNWGVLAEFTKQHNMLLSVSVGPGYNDEAVRPWNAANSRSRKDGKYYDEEWQAALGVHPDFVSITSFNEWHEGTQIEPAIPKSKYQDYLPREPDYYLNRTLHWALSFQRSK